MSGVHGTWHVRPGLTVQRARAGIAGRPHRQREPQRPVPPRYGADTAEPFPPLPVAHRSRSADPEAPFAGATMAPSHRWSVRRFAMLSSDHPANFVALNGKFMVCSLR